VAELYCEQVIVADLDFVSVTELLPIHEFDVAVFGDVLEHLRNPWRVLEETTVIEVRGIYSCISKYHVVTGRTLLQGRFEYTELGILDNTHLDFYTQNS